MKSNFNTLVESTLERYQLGGFLQGDRVKFKKNALKHPHFKEKGDSFLQIIISCMDPKFDLNLRISALKSVIPQSQGNWQVGPISTPDCIYADIIVEYAPGLYRTPMTVPIDVLERHDDGINTGPVPDSIKYPDKVQLKPVEISTQVSQSRPKGFEYDLPTKNVKIPGGNKWDDKSPGARKPSKKGKKKK